MEFLKSPPGADPIVVEGYFAASPDVVFKAWTDPDIVRQWFGYTPNSLASASIELRQGGRWRFVKPREGDKTIGFEGSYVVIEPARRLVFTWIFVTEYASGKREASPPSKVEITFTAQGRGTYVRLVHSAVHSEEARKGFGGGWQGAFTTLGGLFSDL